MRREMTERDLEELYLFAVPIRRKLHQYPEVGFDLERTVKLVTSKLQELGIEHTTGYGKGSVVAEIGLGEEILAIRADLDALPVEEKVDLPYRSCIPGQMHDCGHDAHTAVLLAVAKYLKKHESELTRRVRLIFQPSEEGAVSGAKMLVDSGVMDGVKEIICTHCDNTFGVGEIGTHSGDYMAACIPMTVRFLGRTSHATLPEQGIDAIAMAHEAYTKLKVMVAKEAGDRQYIWSVGRFSGGSVHNVIADRCEMDISFRFYDEGFARRVMKQAEQICAEIAEKFGGKSELLWHISTGAVYNDPSMVESFEQVIKETAAARLIRVPGLMSSEDFGWYLVKAPGMIFRFGTRNEKNSCTTVAHRNDFCIDEEGMKAPIRAFIAYSMR